MSFNNNRAKMCRLITECYVFLLIRGIHTGRSKIVPVLVERGAAGSGCRRRCRVRLDSQIDEHNGHDERGFRLDIPDSVGRDAIRFDAV